MMLKKKRMLILKARCPLLFQTALFLAVLLLFQVVHLPQAQADTAGPNVASTAAGTNWTTPGNTATSDNAYAIYNTTAQNDLRLTNFGFAIPANARIDGIAVEREGNGASAAAAARQYRMGLTKDGTALVGTRKTALALPQTTDDTGTVGTATDLWGTTWTAAEINATTFGLLISDNDTTANALNFDLVRVTVYYTFSISGTVFEDSNFNGTANGTIDLALSNVDVELYTSATNSYISSVISNGTGSYTFTGVNNGTYKVRVRSATIGDADTAPHGGFNACVPATCPYPLPEMTWGDGAPLYGGQSATIDDTATGDNAGPGDTYVSVTVSGANLTGVDFGFAYNLIVNTTDDTNTSTVRSAQGSLKEFIKNANAIGTLNGTTANASQFRIPTSDPNYQAANGYWRITILGIVPLNDNGTTVDGATQTTNVGNNNAAGPEIELFGNGAAFPPFTVLSANNTFKGLIIGGFSAGAASGINLATGGTDNIVSDNYIGTNYNGTAPSANLNGVRLNVGALRNTIGPNNVLSGNSQSGVSINNSGTVGNGNVVKGNIIGTNALGTAALANGSGVTVSGGSKGNTIGGTVAADRNILSGNTGNGVIITGAGSDSNTVVGNYIGLSSDGSAMVPNDKGVAVQFGALTNTIGGTSGAATRNIISGNNGDNLYITDSANGTIIQGNYIGTNVDGTAAMDTDASRANGILLLTTVQNTVIGGSVAGAGNLISGCTTGISILNCSSNSIKGNFIGTDVTGILNIGNLSNGVAFYDPSTLNIVGGTAANEPNRIAYNGSRGISVNGAGSDGNVFSANQIFMNASDGIRLEDAGAQNDQPAPTIFSITPNGVNYDVTATLTPGGHAIEFFRANNAASPVVIPDSPAGEGYLFLGRCVDNGGACVGPYISLVADANAANGTVTVTLLGTGITGGDTVTATTTHSTNGTSPFATNMIVTSTVTGTVYSDEGLTNVGAGKTVRLLVNGVDRGTGITGAAGNYSIAYGLSPGDALLVYINDDALDGTTVTVSNGASLTGLDIYADHLITRQDNGGSLANTSMGTAPGGYVDPEGDILYSVAAGALTVTGANTKLFVPVGHTFAPGGNVSTVHVKINGICDAQSHTITAGGDWDSNIGLFSSGTSSVVLNGTGSLNATGDSFYNLTVGAATRTTTITSNLRVNNVLTIAASTGALTDAAAGYNISVFGGGTPFVNNGAAVSANQFIYGNTGSSTVFVAGGTYNVTNMLWLAGGNTGSGTPYQLNGHLVVNGNLVVAAAGVGLSSLNTSVSDYNITATGLNVTSGMFAVGFLSANGSTVDINGNVVLINGVVGSVDLGSSNWTVSGNWSNTMSVGFNANTSTITFDGTAQTITGNTLFNNFQKTVSSADTLIFAAGSTQTINGTVTLNGVSGQLLSLRSSTPGTRWNVTVNAGAVKAIGYVAVIDSDASGSDASQKPINPTNSLNLGNNIMWFTDTCPTVTNTNNSGTGSLRTCIEYANANPGTTISFNIPNGDPGRQTAGADNWWRIIPLTSLPTITANDTIIDGTTQAAFIGGDPNTPGPEIELFGNGALFSGLTITSANNTVSGLIIGGFNAGAGLPAGIRIDGAAANDNTISNNYIGVNYSGTAAGTSSNARGVNLSNGALRNTVGPGNVIAGNSSAGVHIQIAGSVGNGNIVKGNYIGTNALGTAALANGTGVQISNGSQGNTVGGDLALAAERNVISGNGWGVEILNAGTDNNTVRGNYIGLNANGSGGVPNNAGVYIWLSAQSNTVGGLVAVGNIVPGPRNIISGNNFWGVIISGGGGGTNNNSVIGNYVGTDDAGTTAMGNGVSVSGPGILVASGAQSTVIGSPGAGNLISDNKGAGLQLSDASSSLVQGNVIGMDVNGNALSNLAGGILIDGVSPDNTIGGTTTINDANRVAHNGGPGIALSGDSSDRNIFSANSIFENTGLGISLAGNANNAKLAPTILSITTTDGITSLVIATAPQAGDTIQFFRANNISSPVVTPDSPAGEGYLYLGQCIDDGACSGPFMSSVTDGETVVPNTIAATLSGAAGLTWVDSLSATATDAANGTSPFSANKVVPLKLVKQTYDISGVCIASSDATDAGCGSTSVVNVPAGVVLKFMIIVKNTSAQNVADVRFEDNLDESAGGFSYIPGSLFSAPVGASAPADNATNAAIYSAATNTLTDGIADDIGSARDTGGPAGVDNISIGNVSPGGINAQLDIDAQKSFAVMFQARKK